MNKNLALEALKQMGKPGSAGRLVSGNLLGTELETIEHLKAFVEALRETYPDSNFTSSDVFQWCTNYWSKMPTDAVKPAPMLNAYAFGRFLKKWQAEIGIVEIGSYGNRPVYQILPKQNGKNQ